MKRSHLPGTCTNEMEFEHFLSELQEGEFETFPKAIESDSDKTGTTLYFDIDLGFREEADTSYCIEKGKNEKGKKVCVKYKYVNCISPLTAIFYPKHFDADKPCALLFYFHGMLRVAPGVSTNARDYLNYNGSHGDLRLRNVIAASGKNVILIFPTLGPSRQMGKLNSPDGWQSYYRTVKTYIQNCVIRKELRNEKVILAGHSGSGKNMLKIAGFFPVQEVWGLDALYDGGAPWIELAKAQKELRSFFYDQRDDDKKNAFDEIQKANIDNLKVIRVFKSSRAKEAKQIPGSLLLEPNPDPHFGLILPALRIRLAGLNLPDTGVTPEAENIYDGCSQMRADKCRTLPGPVPLSKYNCSYKPVTMKREFEYAYETVLEDLMNELLYDAPNPDLKRDLNLEFRKKAAEIALTEYQLLWDSGRRKETECLVTDVLIGYYVDGLKFKPAYAKQYVREIQCGKKVKQVDPVTKKKKWVDVPCYTRKNPDEVPPKCYSHAWSATFISWVMRQAIAYTGRDINFHYSSSHIWYMSKGKTAKKKNDSSYPFWTYDVDEVKPEIGDLICFSRPKTKGSECVGGLTAANMTSGKGYCSHCDIVVEVTDTEVHTIGGNTEDYNWGADTVGMKKLPVGTDGKLLTEGKSYVGIIKYIGDK